MKRIVITGFMGSGKSRVARELARQLNLPLIDLDDAITAREGKSPAQLIVENGEPHFRAVESQTLQKVLDSNTSQIIALGGGAWIQETNRKLLDEYDCISVWLDAPFEVCWTRIETSAEERPLGKTKAQARALYDQRKPVYELASIHVKVPRESFQDLISELDKLAADER